MTVKILQKEDPILRKKAEKVKKELIGTDKLNKILSDMKEALHREEDGVAIAAPQIGIPLRIFIVSGKVLNIIKEDEETVYPDMVFINPVIIKKSKEKEAMEEGCLSVRWLYGKVERSKKVTIKAWDENGKEIKVGGANLLAQIFQHETDHLEGILFTDSAIDIQEILPDELKNEGK